MNETEDKVERMRLLTAGFIGNWCYNVYLSTGRGPLNPFLGETYHSKMEDGTEIYLEFVSVKPSTVLVQIISENFTFTGNMVFEVTVAKTMNSAKSKIFGDYHLTLEDNTKYDFKWPYMEIKSLLSSPICMFS